MISSSSSTVEIIELQNLYMHRDFYVNVVLFLNIEFVEVYRVVIYIISLYYFIILIIIFAREYSLEMSYPPPHTSKNVKSK